MDGRKPTPTSGSECMIATVRIKKTNFIYFKLAIFPPPVEKIDHTEQKNHHFFNTKNLNKIGKCRKQKKTLPVL